MVARDTQRFERLCQSTEEPLTEFEAPDIAADEEDYYQHLQDFEQSQESSVKHISRFFNAIRTWLDENPMPNDVALAHPGGWLF